MDLIGDGKRCENICKHSPPEKGKWPCEDCDMRVHDRAEPPEEGGDMICTECENCIEDYNGKPYCFIGQFSLDGISMQRGSPCVDFEPVEE